MKKFDRKKHLKKIARKGNEAFRKKYGMKVFSDMGKKSAAKRWGVNKSAVLS